MGTVKQTYWFTDEEAQRFLKGRSRATVSAYRGALRLYVEWSGMAPKELIDEAEEDRKRPRRHRGKPERRLQDFYEWLRSKYTLKYGKFRGKRGLSKKRAALMFSAIKMFYDENGFPLKIKNPRAMPRKRNFKLKIRPKHVKRLLDYAPTLRDKAIILCLFQGGFDVSTLCSLNYGDVAKELEEDKSPLMLHIIREKEGVEYHTFLGRDAIEALKLYLDERQNKYGEKPSWDTPLFTKYYSYRKNGKGTAKHGVRHQPHLIQKMFREIVVAAGLVSKEQMENADINPARPHALRDAFNQILGLEGVNQLLIDYWMGHRLPYGGAYGIPDPEEQRKIYAEHEQALSVSAIRSGINEIEEKFRREMEKRDYIIKGMEERIKKLEKQLKAMEALANLE
jgi:integrase/recombinase XerD